MVPSDVSDSCYYHFCFPDFFVRRIWFYWESHWWVAQERAKDSKFLLLFLVCLCFGNDDLLCLRSCDSFKVDKLAYKEQEVSLLVKLGRFEEGATLFRGLLSMNPDNYRWYMMLSLLSIPFCNLLHVCSWIFYVQFQILWRPSKVCWALFRKWSVFTWTNWTVGFLVQIP